MLVNHHEHQVHHDENQHQSRKQQDVQCVQASDDVRTGEFASEKKEGNPRTDHRDGIHHAIDDSQPITREQVVGEGIAGKSFSHGQNEEHEADRPVELSRLAECSGEEHSQHVQSDGRNEQKSCPVVDLTHEKATANVERDVKGRCHGGRHCHALERNVRPFVFDWRHGRLEEERQEATGEQDDDEAIQRHFTEQE